MTVSYTVHKGSAGVLDVPKETSSISGSNQINLGGTATFEFREMHSRLTVQNGETVTVSNGDTERFDFVTVESGGTLTVDGTLEADELTNNGTLNVNGTLKVNERFAFELEDLRPYREYAGNATLRETLNGTQRFSERIDESVLDTLVIGVEPDQSARDDAIPGVWGVVERVTDSRNQPLATNVATIELRVLAPFNEYSSVSDVTSDLRID